MTPFRALRRPSRRPKHRVPRRRGLARLCLDGLSYPFTLQSELPQFSGDSRRPLQIGGRDADAIEAELYSHLVPVKRRLWIQRAALLIVRAAVLLVGLQLIAATLNLVGLPLPGEVLLWASIAVGLLSFFFVVQQRITFADAARVLDRRLGLNQVIGTAVELTANAADGRLARLQMRRATEAVRQVDSGEAIGFGVPFRDLRALATAVAITVLFTWLATLSIAWPGSTPVEGELEYDPNYDLAFDMPIEPTFSEGATEGLLDSELFSNQFDDYLYDFEGQSLTPEQLAERLTEIQAALAARAEAANRQRQALNALADALSDSSMTSDAADSLRRGDYEQTSEQIAELAQRSSELSPRARRDLAQRLSEAARQVAPNNPELAQRMQRAAQQLAGNDPQGTEQALNELAEGVGQAGEQMRQLSDSGQPFDPEMMGSYEDLFGPEGEGVLGPGGGEFGDLGDMGELGEGLGSGEFLDDLEMTEGSFAGGQAIPGQTGEGGQAGQGPGREQYRPPDLSDPEQTGRTLELRGRPSESGGSSVEQDGQVPLVASHDGTVATVPGAPVRSAIVDPLTTRGEQNFVPWEKRQIVKDYFSGTAR